MLHTSGESIARNCAFMGSRANSVIKKYSPERNSLQIQVGLTDQFLRALYVINVHDLSHLAKLSRIIQLIGAGGAVCTKGAKEEINASSRFLISSFL